MVIVRRIAAYARLSFDGGELAVADISQTAGRLPDARSFVALAITRIRVRA
jgi:hypothetical protein